MPISDELLAETPYDQYNDLTTIDFPAAYVIPAEPHFSKTRTRPPGWWISCSLTTCRWKRPSQAFTLEGVSYPSGTYVVWMDQPKRGLANTILWDGWDISYDPGLNMYDISSWSHPHLWGVDREIMEDEQYLFVRRGA